MIVYGGIDDFQTILNDVVSIDLTKALWTTIYENEESTELTHTMNQERKIP